METTVADLTALGQVRIGPQSVGHCVYVTDQARWYEAKLEGEGLDKWTPQLPTRGEIRSLSRTLSFDDEDVAVADTEVTINLGSALGTGAVVLATNCTFVTQWSDGDAGAFLLDMGLGASHSYFTASAYDIDGATEGTSVGKPVALPGAGQVNFTITGSVNLNTATAGEATVQVLYCIPETA